MRDGRQNEEQEEPRREEQEEQDSDEDSEEDSEEEDERTYSYKRYKVEVVRDPGEGFTGWENERYESPVTESQYL